MRRAKAVTVAAAWAALVLVTAVAYAAQVRGTVINRDGVARPGCQVTFAGPATYDVWTNSEGVFFLEGPAWGRYDVIVKQGEMRQPFKVTVDQSGLNPATLVVDW